jgi:dTMP kinase
VKKIMKQSKGILISVEGVDGCGKSTFLKSLKELLEHNNIPFLLTKEPGDTPLGKDIRDLILIKDIHVCHKAEYLLYAADRAQHVQEVILPAIERGTMVISDRLTDSSVVYQGYARGLDITTIQYINNWVMNGIQPTLVFYLKIDVKTAFKRIYERNEPLTTIEKQQEEFMQLVHDGFETLFSSRPEVVTLDAHKPSHELAQQAIKTILSTLRL